MKKLICIVLCLLLVLSICGCGKRDKTNDTDNTTNSITASDAKLENIRKNGELPDDLSELTVEEIVFYYEDIFYAVQKFDFDKLTSYLGDNNSSVENLKAIYENKEYKEMWNKTIGQIMYFPSHQLMVSRSPLYVYDRWYTNMANGNETIPDDIGNLEHSVADKLYNDYFQKAPYVAYVLDKYVLDLEIKDGKLKFQINDIFENLGFGEISDMTPKKFNFDGEKEGYARMIMGDRDCLDLGYDYIAKQDNCPNYKVLLSENLNDIMSLIVENEELKSKNDFYYKNYELYYKNEEIRQEIQMWIEENCYIYRNLNTVQIFIKVNPEKAFPYYQANDNEMEKLKKLDVYIVSSFNEFPNNFGNTYSSFYEITDAMIGFDLIKKLD